MLANEQEDFSSNNPNVKQKPTSFNPSYFRALSSDWLKDKPLAWSRVGSWTLQQADSTTTNRQAALTSAKEY